MGKKIEHNLPNPKPHPHMGGVNSTIEVALLGEREQAHLNRAHIHAPDCWLRVVSTCDSIP